MGKKGSDLRTAKCTWVTCKAVEKLNDNPKVMEEFKVLFIRIFSDVFGKVKPKSVCIYLHIIERNPVELLRYTCLILFSWHLYRITPNSCR